MNTPPECLTSDAISRYLRGEMSAAEASGVQSHVDACPACAERLIATADPDPPYRAPVASHPQAATTTQGAVKPAGRWQEMEAIVALMLTRPEAPGELGRLGGYPILAILGVGGMGVVFRARDPRLAREVAIKAMLPEIAVRSDARERFLREARAAAAIEHHSIVTIHHVDEDRGIPFLVMPLLRGQSLQDRLREGTPLTIAEVVSIGREVALGLAAAHAQGLIHRDIKPGNLWLLDGPLVGVKILDFGLARRDEPAGSTTGERLTQEGAVLGTPAYMAPEQARGDPVDFRADLYSLGVLLYQLSSGRLPFSRSTPQAYLLAHASETPTDVRQRNPAIPETLACAIMQLLEKDPANRPTSASEVARMLTRVAEPVSPLPLGRHPPGLAYVFGAVTAERATYYGTASILGGLIMATLGVDRIGAAQVFLMYMAFVYAFSLLGGFLGDRWFGRYPIARSAVIPAGIGIFMLGVHDAGLFVLALFLLALGHGLLKPNVPALLAASYANLNRTVLFGEGAILLVASFNVGALLGFTFPWLSSFGEFICPALGVLLMSGYWLMLTLGKPHFGDEQKPSAPATSETPAWNAGTWASCFVLFAFATLHLFLYRHIGSLWDSACGKHLGEETVWIVNPATIVRCANPVSILLLTPAVLVLVRWLASRGQPIDAARGLCLGILFDLVTLLAMARAGFFAEQGDPAPIWLWVTLFVFGLGEIAVWASGYALLCRIVPASHWSLAMGCWMLTYAPALILFEVTKGWTARPPVNWLVLVLTVTALAVLCCASFLPSLLQRVVTSERQGAS